MKRNLFWKFLFVLFVVGWAAWELYPPTSQSVIDVFEQRAASQDTNFTAIVEQARTAQGDSAQSDFLSLSNAVGSVNLAPYFPDIPIPDGKTPNAAILEQLQADARGELKLGLDLQGGTSFLVGVDTNALEDVDRRATVLAQAVEVLRKRVDKFGVAEPLIQPAGENRILIQLPGLTSAEMMAAKEQIQKAAFLEFRLVHPRSNELLQQGIGAPGYEQLVMTQVNRDGQKFQSRMLVKRSPEQGLTGHYVSRAFVTPQPITGMPAISLTFNNEGAQIFADITRANVGGLLGIVLDGELYSAPRIDEPILTGSASITGDFTLEEASQLANVLENPLEAPVNIESQYSVEPSLGRDSINSGVRASLIAAIAVAVFMLAYYLFAGVVANVALLLNIIILLGVMASLDATLTLPGIAGIVLTIGMAVDANVLIFERIREEREAGKSLRGAVGAGYEKAFSTIFDANITTLIASIILIFMGTGPVKGFGVTLTIGVMVSMFTALVVTRLIMDWALVNGWLKSLKMLRFINPQRINFLKFSKPAFAASWVLVAVGIGYGFYRGTDAVGVDFLGGDRLTFAFEEKVEVGAVRDAIAALEVGEPLLQYQQDPLGGQELLQVTTMFDSGPKVQAGLKEAFPEARFSLLETFTVGPTIGQEILKTAMVAMLLALFGILIYVAMRYEFSFAIAAIVATIHDILMTVGWFCLTGREFTAPMVAAVLTIVGFSMNDTIVVFDRIRESLKLGVRGSFADIINESLSRTLSRTLITSGTTLLATVALYLFGGPVINDFAFTFIVGILTGTYSSIYIASAFLLWWHKGEKPKTAAQTVYEPEAVRV